MSATAERSPAAGSPDGGTMATFGGGVTTGVGRMSPVPATSAPPTTSTAATASSVKPRRRSIGRVVGCRGRDRGEALAQVGGRALDAVDLRGVPGAQPLLELVVGHRSVPLVSAASMASCSRFSA